MYRRYSDFVALQEFLIGYELDQVIPPLPEKNFMDKLSNDSSQFVEARIESLQKFLDVLIQGHSPILRPFSGCESRIMCNNNLEHSLTTKKCCDHIVDKFLTLGDAAWQNLME